MRQTWNGNNRPTPTRGEGTVKEIILHWRARPHEGLFFIFAGHDESN